MVKKKIKKAKKVVKKIKRVIKIKKKVIAKKKVVAKKKVAPKKKVVKISTRVGTGADSVAEINRAKAAGEKAVGMIEHYFDKISVAAMKVRAPFKVGDTLHIKGHTTDLMQVLESMQIEHQSITEAKKGQDIGFKVKARVREHDIVYVAPAAVVAVQTPIFPSMSMAKPVPNTARSLTSKPAPTTPPKPAAGGYGNTKFLNF